MNKLKEFKIDKSKLGRKIGFIIEKDEDFFNNEFRNIVRGYIGDEMVLVKTNMNQSQFDKFTFGELTEEELHRII